MGPFQLLWTLVTLLLISLPALHVCSSDTASIGLNTRGDGVHCDVEVDASSVTATTDSTYLCATLDWYPEDRCSYGSCSWDHASILNLVSPPPDLVKNSLRNDTSALFLANFNAFCFSLVAHLPSTLSSTEDSVLTMTFAFFQKTCTLHVPPTPQNLVLENVFSGTRMT